MLYREAGKTGHELSILGFGAMRLPILEGKPHLIDEPKAQAMLDYALRHGVNYFDTAYVYHSESPSRAGMSEVFLGRALKSHRQQVRLATKLPGWLVKSRADMDRLLDEQLQRLQTSQIDFYLLHSLGAETWKNLRQLEVTAFLDAALADGRIKYAGFSFHDEAPLFKEILQAYDWSFCQVQYNYMDERFQAGRGGMELAAARGLAVIVMEPLRGGSLANRIPPDVQTLWRRANLTPVEGALRFVWNHPAVSVALSGMSSLEHVVENVRLAETGRPQSLTPQELNLIAEVRAIYQARTRVPCTSCGYCLPCPNGVAIPANFEQLNNIFIYNAREKAAFIYHHILAPEQRASHCEECGQCEDLCPQKIPVRAMLQEVMKELEPSAARKGQEGELRDCPPVRPRSRKREQNRGQASLLRMPAGKSYMDSRFLRAGAAASDLSLPRPAQVHP